MKTDTLVALAEARAAQRPIARVVRLSDGLERVSSGSGDGPLEEATRTALRLDRASAVDVDGERWLIQPFNPPLRLVLVGAVHIAQALSPMAARCGYEVTIVDPRAAFAQAERFDSVRVIDAWPDEAMASLDLDARTGVITLTHDPKLDDPALEVALKSPVFYIGCLGSRRTQAARLERLTQKGFGPDELARIHGPVGLDIGARTPSEIAVSILAEVTQTLRKGSS